MRPYLEKPFTKIGLVKALNSSPSTTKKKKKKRESKMFTGPLITMDHLLAK
jgi:hypothetical protein